MCIAEKELFHLKFKGFLHFNFPAVEILQLGKSKEREQTNRLQL